MPRSRTVTMSMLLGASVACSAVPDVVYRDEDAGDAGLTPGPRSDAGVPDARPDAAKEVGCPDNPPPNAICCGNLICQGCVPTQCERCVREACPRATTVCCARGSGNGAVECRLPMLCN